MATDEVNRLLPMTYQIIAALNNYPQIANMVKISSISGCYDLCCINYWL
jgi:hypothetical protein